MSGNEINNAIIVHVAYCNGVRVIDRNVNYRSTGIRVGIVVAGTVGSLSDRDVYLLAFSGESAFLRGDANQDGSMDISDAIFTLISLFRSPVVPGCLDALDSNDDGSADLSDVVFSLTFLFRGGDAVPAPFTECGGDRTDDGLSCDEFRGCR